MLEPELVSFLQGGCATIVGSVSANGEPQVARGWGTVVLDPSAGRLRLLLSADDVLVVDLAAAGSPMAVTGADVRTFRSVQVKGRSLGVEPTTDADVACADRFCDAFFTDIVETDGTPRELVEQMRPATYVACHLQIDQVFDQTPGPGAGASLR